MATFERKTWTDRVSEYPTRRTLTYPASGVSDIVTVERNEGTITNQGDAFNATNMNDLESRINTCVEEMNSNFQAGVDAVYAACVAEGVTPSASSPTAIAAAISDIRSGGTAQAAHILNPYTAYSSKVLRTGSMVNRGAWTSSTSNDGRVTIPQGYHNGSGYVNFTGRSAGRTEAFPSGGGTTLEIGGPFIEIPLDIYGSRYVLATVGVKGDNWLTVTGGTLLFQWSRGSGEGRYVFGMIATDPTQNNACIASISSSYQTDGWRCLVSGPCR